MATARPQGGSGCSGKQGGSGILIGSKRQHQQQQQTSAQMKLEELLRMRQPKRKGRKPTKKERTTYINIDEDQFKDIVHELTGSWEALVKRSQQQQQMLGLHNAEAMVSHSTSADATERCGAVTSAGQEGGFAATSPPRQQAVGSLPASKKLQKSIALPTSPALPPHSQSARSARQEASVKLLSDADFQEQAGKRAAPSAACAALQSQHKSAAANGKVTAPMSAPCKQRRLDKSPALAGPTSTLLFDKATGLTQTVSCMVSASSAGASRPAAAADTGAAAAAAWRPARASGAADLSWLTSLGLSTSMTQQDSAFPALPVLPPHLLASSKPVVYAHGRSRGPAAGTGAAAFPSAAAQSQLSTSALTLPVPPSAPPLRQVRSLESCAPFLSRLNRCAEGVSVPAESYGRQTSVARQVSALASALAAKLPLTSSVHPVEASRLASASALGSSRESMDVVAMPIERLAAETTRTVPGPAAGTAAAPTSAVDEAAAPAAAPLCQDSRRSPVPSITSPKMLPVVPATQQAHSPLSSADAAALAVATFAKASPYAAQLLSLALQLREAKQRTKDVTRESAEQDAQCGAQVDEARALREGDSVKRGTDSKASFPAVQQLGHKKVLEKLELRVEAEMLGAEPDKSGWIGGAGDQLALTMAVTPPVTPPVQEHAKAPLSLELTLGLPG